MEIGKNISKTLFNPIKLPMETWPSFSGGDLIHFSNSSIETKESIEYKKSALSHREREKAMTSTHTQPASI